jgi:ABC-type microcin C transport system permease subunit YejE
MQNDNDNTRESFMASKQDRMITGLVILGFAGFLLFGINGAIVGAIVGALIGYFWDFWD